MGQNPPPKSSRRGYIGANRSKKPIHFKVTVYTGFQPNANNRTKIIGILSVLSITWHAIQTVHKQNDKLQPHENRLYETKQSRRQPRRKEKRKIYRFVNMLFHMYDKDLKNIFK